MKPNMTLNLIGVILILIAGIGLMVVGEEQMEGPGEEKVGYDIRFVVSPKTGPVDSGSVNDGGSTLASLDVVDHNITSLQITISWSDNFVPAATAGTLDVTVTVSGPNDQSESHTSSGRQDSFTFEFDELNEPYEDLEKELKEGTADAWLSEEFPALDAGTGTWEITITMDRSRPTIGNPGGRASMDYDISINYDYFTGRAVEQE